MLEEAKQSKNLVGVRELLQHWRHFAYQELREPGAYFRVLATAARAQATRRAPAGSVKHGLMINVDPLWIHAEASQAVDLSGEILGV